MIYEQTTQRLTLIRIGESGWAVLEREDGQQFDFPADWLPYDAVAGGVIVLRRKKHGNDSNLRLFVNQNARQAQEKEAEGNDKELENHMEEKEG